MSEPGHIVNFDHLTDEKNPRLPGRDDKLTIDDIRIEVVKDHVAEIRVVPDQILSLVRVSVVIPTLNEADNLSHVFERLSTEVFEVILVDGNSTDGTVEIAKRLWPRLRVVTQTGTGKGNALTLGFWAATGDIIVMLDADGSTDPAESLVSSLHSSPERTSRKVAGSLLGEGAPTSLLSGASAIGGSPRLSTTSGAGNTAISATATMRSGAGSCLSFRPIVTGSRSKPL